jgi:vacuolar-type H+-ATPase subunit E/Vma4
MAIEQLIGAVEVSAEETIQEIQRKAVVEVAEDRKAAEDGAAEKKRAAMEEARRRAAVERGRLISGVRKENRMELAREKDRIFRQAFDEAGRRLASMRGSSGYEKSFRAMAAEALEELGGGDLILHVDIRDEPLARKTLAALGKNCEVKADLETAGGLNVTTKDGRNLVFNTLESRLEKAKKSLKSEIFSMLYG